MDCDSWCFPSKDLEAGNENHCHRKCLGRIGAGADLVEDRADGWLGETLLKHAVLEEASPKKPAKCVHGFEEERLQRGCFKVIIDCECWGQWSGLDSW